MDYNLRDPASLLRTWKSRSLQQFAEELYTLLVSAGAADTTAEAFAGGELASPPAEGGPIAVPAPTPALLAASVRERRLEAERTRTLPFLPGNVTLMAAEAGPAPRRAAPVPESRAAVAAPRALKDVVRLPAPEAPPPLRSRERPLPPGGVRAPGVVPASDSRTKGFTPEQPLLDIGEWAALPLGGGGGKTFLGKVASGTGATYQVTLYSSGPTGPPDSGTITVTIPQIDPQEQIPPGTWFVGIIQITDASGNISYAYQPPVWVA